MSLKFIFSFAIFLHVLDNSVLHVKNCEINSYIAGNIDGSTVSVEEKLDASKAVLRKMQRLN